MHATSVRGDENVVQQLLNIGAGINVQGECFGNTMQAVSTEGYEKLVQQLQDKGENVNAQGGEYGNALKVAMHWRTKGHHPNAAREGSWKPLMIFSTTSPHLPFVCKFLYTTSCSGSS